MSKPTSEIIADLIKFVSADSHVSAALKQRDNDGRAACTEIRCRFYKQHSSDPARSAYEVAFVYSVNDDALEESDDVLVRVERNTSTGYKIWDVKFF